MRPGRVIGGNRMFQCRREGFGEATKVFSHNYKYKMSIRFLHVYPRVIHSEPKIIHSREIFSVHLEFCDMAGRQLSNWTPCTSLKYVPVRCGHATSIPAFQWSELKPRMYTSILIDPRYVYTLY